MREAAHSTGNAVPGNLDVRGGASTGQADEDVGVPGRDDVGGGSPRCADGGGGPGEWYSRGYLPHRDRRHLLQAVTFRLADSLPRNKLRELEMEMNRVAEDRMDAERRKKIEQWLDSGMGGCALGHPAVAQVVQDSLLRFHDERYQLLAWCIMPNHVHVLVEPRYPLAKIVQGWKSYTARWALARNVELGLGIPDPRHLWMREYWDRYIRDEKHLKAVIDYIHHNPVKAGLCGEPAGWRWSSAGNVDDLVGSSAGQADEDVGVPRRADGDGGAPGHADGGGGRLAGGGRG